MKRLVIGAAAIAVVIPIALADLALGRPADPHGFGAPPGIPPGLAKKPYGLPPGQAKKLWRAGQKLPHVYIDRRYFIVDPWAYRLPPPPPGHRWVLIEGDAYLVHTADGLIANVIADIVLTLAR